MRNISYQRPATRSSTLQDLKRSPNDVAAAFTSALGKTVHTVPIPDETLETHFEMFVNPETAAALQVAEMSRGWNSGLIAWEEGIKVEKGQTGIDKAVASWLSTA